MATPTKFSGRVPGYSVSDWRILARHLSPLLIIAIIWSGTIGVVYASNGGGYALDFDGVDEYVDIGNYPIFDFTTSLTIEAWVKASSTQPEGYYGRIVDKYNHALQTGYTLCRDAGATAPNTAYFSFWGTDGSLYSVNGTTIITNDQWYHLAATYDGNTMKIYVNGVLEGQKPVSKTISASTNPLRIGNAYDGNRWTPLKGIIDEVRVWNVVRTPGEIQANMHKTLTGSEPGLVGNWRFDEGSGTTTQDQTANNHDGALTNMEAGDWLSSTAPIGNLTTHKNDIAAMWAAQTSTASDGFTIGLDIANVSFLNETGDDIVFGHNNAAFANVTTNLPVGVDKRWARVWELIVTDLGPTGGNVDLTFDISDAGGQGNFSASSTYFLLKRAVGSSADFTTVPVVSTSVSGDQLTFRVDVNNLGSEFTLGATADSPTAVILQRFSARGETGDYRGVLLVGILALSIVSLILVRHLRRLGKTCD